MTAKAARGNRLGWVVLVSFLVAAPGAAALNDWPGFQRDELHSGLAAGKEPNQALDLLWSLELDGQVKGSPVVADGIVYIGTDAGQLYAMDAKTGFTKWGPVKLAEGIHGTPAVENDRLYVATSTADGSAGKIYVLQARTGSLIMNITMGAGAMGGILIQDGKLFVGNDAGKLLAYETQGMGKLWEFSTALTIDTAQVPANEDDPCCLRTNVAAKAVKSTPVAFQGRVYFGSFNHQFFAVDSGGNPGTETTKLAWVENIHDIVYSSAGIYSPTGRVVVGSYNGKLYNFDTKPYGFQASCDNVTGRTYHAVGNDCASQIYWRYDTGSRIYSSPAIANDRAYVGDNDGTVHSVHIVSGQSMWKYKTGGGIFSSPAVVNRTIVVGSYDGHVYMFKENDQGLLTGDPFKYKLSDKIHSSPAIVDGVVYVASQDGIMYALADPADIPDEPPAPPPGKTKADLRINGITFAADPVTPGTPVDVTVTVANAGDAATGPFTLRVYQGETLLSEGTLDIQPNSSGQHTFTMTPESAQVTLRAVADEAAAVDESSTDNNAASFSSQAPAQATDDPAAAEKKKKKSEEDAPGAGLALVLAAMGAVLVVLRRRR